MGEVFVVVEHRLGEIRDISLEMLWKAGELARGYHMTLQPSLLAMNQNPLLRLFQTGPIR